MEALRKECCRAFENPQRGLRRSEQQNRNVAQCPHLADTVL